jgi:hypothetical protein
MPVNFLVPLNAGTVSTGTIDVVTKGTLADIDVNGIALFKNDTTFDVIPTAPTAPINDSSLKLATTAYTQAALTALETKLVGGAPEALDTLKEISDFLISNETVGNSLIKSLALKANIESPTFTGTVSGITATMVGLGNVDNTSDLYKIISNDTQTALDTINTALNLKAVTTDVNTSLDLKADKTYVDTNLNLKADKTYVDDNLNLKATISSVNAEINRAGVAEGLLTTNLTGETTRATDAESILRTDIANEISRATGIDTTLNTALSAETTRATEAEGILRTNLDAETNRAIAAENLKANINSPTFTGTLNASDTTINGTLSTTNTIVENTLTIKGKDTYGDYIFKSKLNGITDKLVLAKKNNGTETIIMEMSQDGASAINQVDTVTFSAPVVMASSLVLLNLPSYSVTLLTGQIYVTDDGFLKIK